MSLSKNSGPAEKIQTTLTVIGIVFILFSLRIWQLAFLQHEEKLQEARLTGKRVEIEKANRGGIRDRFNEPLALNKLKFQAAILYSDLKKIPTVKWELDGAGVKQKVYKRKAYIKELAALLGDELKLDPDRMEDEIHAKASQFYNIPYIVKESITEQEYARLKQLARKWPGLHPMRSSERVYPQGKLAADVLGYLGKIGKSEYDEILKEREELRLYLDGLETGADLPLPEGFLSIGEVKRRVKELEELAYSGSDSIGKTGIESLFEEELRGLQGKKVVYKDSQGILLKEYPGTKEPIPGKRILLTLSRELQDYAEKLLTLTEDTRDTRVKIGSNPTKMAEKTPWIKGGAIIAMDPNSGEILALASYPRIDPNDFNGKNSGRIHEWLEDDIHLSKVWDGLIPLTRERYNYKTDTYYEEALPLTWETYLNFILSKEGSVKKALVETYPTLAKAVKALKAQKEDPKVLDLLQLALDERLFTPELLEKVGHFTLKDHRLHEQYLATLLFGLEEILANTFAETEFKAWRLLNETAFIQEKRALEKEEKKYPKPYLDYLDEEERKQFQAIWDSNKMAFLLTFISGKGPDTPYTHALFEWRKEIEGGAHSNLFWMSAYKQLKEALRPIPDSLKEAYLLTLRTFSDLERPLRFKWKVGGKKPFPLKERDLALAFHPYTGWGYGRSHAYRQSTIQGSIFKLVTAYAALMEKEKSGASLPEIEDLYFKQGKEAFVGYHANKTPIPQLYKGGRIPRSHSSRIGKVDLLSAIELSSNPYFSLLAADTLKKPSDLLEAAKKFSYGSKTGIDLPYELSGRLPKDLDTNPTGLFATAIGQHSLVVTPLQTSIQLSTLANGGQRLKPQILKMVAGKKCGSFYEEIPTPERFFMKDGHYLAGLDFPLASLPPCKEEPLLKPIGKEVKEVIDMPLSVQNTLLEGMRRVVKRQTKSSLFSLSRIYKDYPGFIADFVDIKSHMIGKTSTSEAIERLDLDTPDEIPLYTHVWFGGISYKQPVKPFKFEEPELVVIVYLRYGGYGNEAAPIAAEIAKKWREINEHKSR